MARKRKRDGLDNLFVPVLTFLTLAAGLLRGVRRGSGAQQAPGRPREPAADGGPGKKSVLDKVAARVPLLRFPVAVQHRFSEARGNYLAGSISLQAFLSLFPLLLVLIAVAGFVSSSASVDLADRVVRELGLTGDAASAVHDALDAAVRSRRAASVVGLAGLLWSGLALVGALQYAYNQIWQVQERGAKDRLIGLGWLVGAALVFVASAAITTVLNFLPGFLSPLGFLVAVATNVLLWWWTAYLLPNRNIGWRPLLPGALVGGIGLELLKLVGGFYVPRLISSSSQLYGSIGIVFAMLAWLLLFGKLVVYSAVVNVLLWERRVGTKQAVVSVPAGVERTTHATRNGRLEDVA